MDGSGGMVMARPAPSASAPGAGRALAKGRTYGPDGAADGAATTNASAPGRIIADASRGESTSAEAEGVPVAPSLMAPRWIRERAIKRCGCRNSAEEDMYVSRDE